MISVFFDFYCSFFFFKQKTAYEMRISDWSSDVCSSDLFKRLRILQTQDGGQSWNEMPLQLSLCSRLLLFFAAHPYWPPGDVLRAGCDGPQIWFEYRDDTDEIGRAHV